MSGKMSIFELIRRFMGHIGWKLYLWGYAMTEKSYWEEMDLQYKEQK